MNRGISMNAIQWSEQPYFAALDWARAHHDVVIIDRLGQIKETSRFEHTAEGWQGFQNLTRQYPQLPVAVITEVITGDYRRGRVSTRNNTE